MLEQERKTKQQIKRLEEQIKKEPFNKYIVNKLFELKRYLNYLIEQDAKIFYY